MHLLSTWIVRHQSLLVRGSIIIDRCTKVLAFLDVSLLDMKTATFVITLDELLLSLTALLIELVGEILLQAHLRWVVLANEDWLQAEFVKSLQVATARLALLRHDRTPTANL